MLVKRTKTTPLIIMLFYGAFSLGMEQTTKFPKLCPNHHLLLAASNGNLSEIQIALSRGAYIDIEDSFGITPLMQSIYSRKSKAAHFLLDHNASVRHADKDNQTPLHRAVSTIQPDLSLIRRILQKGADIDAQTLSLETPLHMAAAKPSLLAVYMLMKYNANINAQNNIGLTPPMCGVLANDRNIVKLFAFKEADFSLTYPDFENLRPKTALDLALEVPSIDPEIINVLKNPLRYTQEHKNEFNTFQELCENRLRSAVSHE